MSSPAAAGRPPGRSIEFSGADNPIITTNLTQPDRRADALKQVEQDLRAPLDIFSFAAPADTLEAPFRRPVPRPLSKQAVDQIKKNRNLIWMTPEEMLLESSSEDPLKPSGKGADERAKRARLDDYYLLHRAGARLGMESGPWRESDEVSWRSPVGNDMRDETAVPAGVKASEKELRKALSSSLDDESIGLSSSRDGFSDIFHTRRETSADDERTLLQHQAKMQEYRQVMAMPMDTGALGFRSAARTDAASAPVSGFTGAGDFLGAHKSQNDKLDPSFGKLRPLPAGVPQTSSGSTSLFPNNPVDIEPRPADRTPPRPTFLAPKRPFL